MTRADDRPDDRTEDRVVDPGAPVRTGAPPEAPEAAVARSARELVAGRAVLVLANPAAARLRDPERRAGLVEAIVRALRAAGAGAVEVREPTDPGAIRTAATAAVEAGAALVVAAGGDGTLREVAQAAAGRPVTVALVPAGTGNLFAAGLGLPGRAEDALALLRAGRPGGVDVGQVVLRPPAGAVGAATPASRGEESIFLVACGTGFDARMLVAARRWDKARHGLGAYLAGALRAGRDLRPRPVLLTVDGREHELSALVVLVVNAGVLVPGLLRPRLAIDPADGALDVFAVTAGGLLPGLAGVAELLGADRPGRTRLGAGVRLRGRRVTVAADPPQLVEVDGDVFGRAVLEAGVRPAALSVLLPVPRGGA